VVDQLVQVHQHRHAFPRSAADDSEGHWQKSSGNGWRRHFPLAGQALPWAKSAIVAREPAMFQPRYDFAVVHTEVFRVPP
jgi:hypothetical protein